MSDAVWLTCLVCIPVIVAGIGFVQTRRMYRRMLGHPLGSTLTRTRYYDNAGRETTEAEYREQYLKNIIGNKDAALRHDMSVLRAELKAQASCTDAALESMRRELYVHARTLERLLDWQEKFSAKKPITEMGLTAAGIAKAKKAKRK